MKKKDFNLSNRPCRSGNGGNGVLQKGHSTKANVHGHEHTGRGTV